MNSKATQICWMKAAIADRLLLCHHEVASDAHTQTLVPLFQLLFKSVAGAKVSLYIKQAYLEPVGYHHRLHTMVSKCCHGECSSVYPSMVLMPEACFVLSACWHMVTILLPDGALDIPVHHRTLRRGRLGLGQQSPQPQVRH